MRRPHTAQLLERMLGAAVIAMCLASVEIAVGLEAVNGRIVPAPSAVLRRAIDIVASGEILEPLATTLSLLFAAYFAASAAAVMVGIAMGRFPAIYNLLEPLVETIRPLPKAALLPLLIILLGLGNAMKMTAVGLAVFFPVLINTIQAVRGVDPVLVDTARTFACSRLALLCKVILPASLPLIVVGMRVSLALGLILVVITEMIAGNGGLGYLIADMQRSFKVLDMYAWVTILAVLGYGLNSAFVAVERRTIYWATETR